MFIILHQQLLPPVPNTVCCICWEYDMAQYNNMINKNYAEDIRACERIKFDQALYILTMYQKKIRKSRKNIPAIVDADTEMQDIICSWKNKWKMDLTKPILNCVTSVYPRILVDLSRNENEQLANYNQMNNKFLTRLRTEHEDETNFKLVFQMFDRQINYMTNEKCEASTKATVKGLLTMCRDLANIELQNIQKNQEIVSNEMLDVNTNNLQWQVWRPLKYIKQIAQRALNSPKGMDIEDDIEPKSISAENLVTFSNNVVKIMERIKESEHGSTLITIQPKIDELTLLFHPLLAAIMSNFKKQNHQKTKDYNWQKIQVQSIPMMQNPKSSYNCSRVVFINFDGYQSEYNLEIARNFKKHLLYISFPKQQAKLDDVKQIYSRRFFKKLMFRYSQALFQSFSQNTVSQDYRALTKMDRLLFNPQDYHCSTEKLYEHKNDKSGQDFNQNIYVFPIRMAILRQKFPQAFESKEDIENHQSYFIRFIIKDFLLNQIREFNPTLIMMSYSGRIHIEDSHFVQLMQQFTKIANYKLLLFPNLTSAFVTQQMSQIQDQSAQICDYDNFICDQRIAAPLSIDSNMGEQWMQLFNKISRFLKVSSGTYNLNRSFEQQPLVSKYKNQFILTYIDDIMTVLGKEYPNIDKIRFRNRDLSILPKLFEENIKNIKKTFDHTVPKVYSEIYQIIQYLLLDRAAGTNDKIESMIGEYLINVGEYKDFIAKLYDEILNKSNFQVVSMDCQSMSEAIYKERLKKMKEVFKDIKESHYFQISSEKYEEKSNIYIKINPENKEYSSISEETESLKGLFEAIFFLNPGKINLKIYETTKLLYKIDQRSRRNNKIPILIMNNLTQNPQQNSFQSYYSQLDITNAYQGGDKKNFQQRKCQATPIIFQNQNGQIDNKKKIYIYAEWNYHQSQEYILLYWPSKYDFFKAFLMKMMNKPYQPEILNEIYLYRKGSKQPIFRKLPLMIENEIAARVGASSYEYEGKIFIFGGFYERQKNYLELQHDIVTFDVRTFEQTGETKLLISNLKPQMYGRINFDQRLKEKKRQNSFIRPRMQFQFYEKDELYGEDQILTDQNTKQVIMIGGYGQNFLRPYSLLTYFYYILRFQRASRTLTDIQRKIIYNKAIPINTREMTKNLGVIKTNKKTKAGSLQTKKLTDPDAYTLYRNSFKIDVKDGEEEFNYKFKYMFSEDQYKSFKQEIKKIQELRAEEFDSSSISIEKDPKNNHRIVLEKEGKKREVQLRMEIPTERAKKIEGNPKQVNLTHESIIHLDIWNSMICAIVKHDKYTQGKSVLVQYNTKGLQSFNFEQDTISHLAMSWIKEFDYDLTLHILIIGNKNTVAILHGQKLTIAESLKEYIVKRKKTKNQIAAFEIKQREQCLRKNQQSVLINTIFFRNRNKINSIDFISIFDSSYFYISCQEIELNISNDQFRWNTANIDKFDPTYKYQFCFSQKNFVRMEQLRFVQCFKNNNDYLLTVEHNRKKYSCEISKNSRVLILKEEDKSKTETENMQKGIILLKTQDKYNDRDFF